MRSAIAKIGRMGLFSRMPLAIPPVAAAPFMGNAFIPSVALIPLRQHSGKAARPVVRPGSRVREGQLIAVQESANSANVYSSLPGILHEYRAVPLAGQTVEMAAVIEVSGRFSISGSRASPRDLESASASSLLVMIEDLGLLRTFRGKTEPLSPLLRSFQEELFRGGEEGILALRMYDYDPSCNVDSFLAENYTEAVLKGALLAAKIAGAKRLCLLYKNKKALARSKLQGFAAPEGIEVIRAASSDVYPCGSEHICKQDALKAFGKGSSSSVFCINSWTAFSVFSSLRLSRPVLQRPVLVAGQAIAFPYIVNVRIGTRVRDLLAASTASAGENSFEPSRIVAGGLIAGKAIHDLDTPVDLGVDAVYFLGKGERRLYSAQRCIHCGRCLRACPSRLDPARLAAAVQDSKPAGKDSPKPLQNEVSKCISCGVCSISCPAGIPLHHIICGTLGGAPSSADDLGGGEN